MKITAENYERLKAFFNWMIDRHFDFPDDFPPEDHPSNVLQRFEQKSPAMARKSLATGLGDILSGLNSLPREEIKKLDLALSGKGLPTLTSVLLEFSAKIGSIMKRGQVRNEEEYHALRNLVEDMDDPEQQRVWQMLGNFELKVGAQ